MTADQHQPDLSTAALIRAAADNELTADQRARLDTLAAADPDIARQIESERELRKACKRVMSDCPAPSASLRDRVAAAAAAGRGQYEAGSNAGEDAVAAAIEDRSAETRNQSFWSGVAASPVVRSFGAMAAVLLVGLVLFLMGAPVGDATTAHAQEVARFVSGEHNRCAMDPAAVGKFDVQELERIPERFAGLTGQAVTVADLLDAETAGLRFIDAGGCHIPGSKASMHIRFETDGHPDCPDRAQVSLFIQPDSGYLELAEGKAYRLQPEDASSKQTVIAWRRDGLSYVLVSDRAEACPKVLQSAGLPEQLEQI